MYFFIIFCLAIQCGWASYHHSHRSSYGSTYKHNNYSNHKNSDSPDKMLLSIERVDTRIENFLRSPRETEDGIEPIWYKLDEDNNVLRERNFQNNVLRILLEQLTEQFHESEENRSDMVKGILDFLNEFIKERFIPGAYHDAIKKIFNFAKDLQYKPALNVTNIVFDELSTDAQTAFRDGVRVQTSGFTRLRNSKSSESVYADPILVEILFMQLVWDAQKRNSTRQKLLDSIEADMSRIENLFGDDPAYTIVGSFSNLRSSIVQAAEEESPLPALIKYIISLVKNSKNEKKDIEDKYKEFLEDKASDQWKIITKTKAKPAISIWKKKEAPPQENENAKAKKEKKKKKKALVKKLEGDAINSVKTKGLSTDAFKDIMNDVLGNVSKLGGGGSGLENVSKLGGENLLGSLLG